MHNQTLIIDWAIECLISLGYTLEHKPAYVLSTPWSNVYRFSTSKGDIYLKQTPPALFISSECEIIRILHNQFHASVPQVIAFNNTLHCFMMLDAGRPLRQSLKSEFSTELLCRAINEYAAILRSTEMNNATFLKLGVPDWRPEKLPMLYNKMVSETEFLKSEGLTDAEIKTLQSLRAHFVSQCEYLASQKIPSALGYHDFHDNNVLYDANTDKLTIADWSETAIIHPFFSLLTCLQQAIIHHGVQEGDQTYRSLQDACLENWSEIASKSQLTQIFSSAKKAAPIYGALACYHFIMSVDQAAYKAYYSNRPSKIAMYFRQYIADNSGFDPFVQ